MMMYIRNHLGPQAAWCRGQGAGARLCCAPPQVILSSGVKPSIAGDLRSEGGMGLFGIPAHGITETFVMEKALIGLVACESKRHTGENIKEWTDDALNSLGLTPAQLLLVA